MYPDEMVRGAAHVEGGIIMTSIQSIVRSMIDNQLMKNNIPYWFPEYVSEFMETGLEVAPCSERIDFTSDRVFTIDSETSKDMDDAIEVRKEEYGYRLAVHIADVSSYVQPGSPLDRLVYERGTSFYFPGLTIPMLPEILSNDLCSLNPGARRNTMSLILKIDHSGSIIDMNLSKGIILSRVKGIYSEINQILGGFATESLKAKYHEVISEIPVMVELYNILHEATIKRGAVLENYEQAYVMLSEHDIDLLPVDRGLAEKMVEEFMITANTAVSQYMIEHNLPAIFRVQKAESVMASYQPVLEQHASLKLESYTHFTSPIRRLCDTKIHQIISMYLDGYSNEAIHETFDAALPLVSIRATRRGRVAMVTQQKVANECYKLFFQINPGMKCTGSMVNRNHEKRPIIRIDALNVNVLGYDTRGNRKIGDRFSFNVYASNNAVYANNMQLLIA